MQNFKGLSKEQKLLAGTILLILILIGIRFFDFSNSTNENTEFANDSNKKNVDLFSLKATTTGATVPTIGQISSLQNVDVRAQISERITAIPVRIGDRVAPGSVLAILNTSDLQANLRAAEANLDASRANYNEITSGARSEQRAISRSQVDNAQVAYANALQSLDNAILSTYATIDDVIANKTDILFTSPQSNSPSLIFSQGSFQARTDIINNRLLTQALLEKNTTDQNATQAIEDIEFVIKYLDLLSGVVNNLSSGSISETELTTWKTTVSTARTGAQGAKTALLSAQEKATLSATSLSIAEDQLELTEAGATDNQLLGGRAQVDAAQAQYESALLALNKATIISPISGTVSQVPVTAGDLITPGQLIATVVNTSGLKITAYVNERDAALIDAGTQVYVEDILVGSVARIAPSINPETKKVEVEIAIFESENKFVVGQYVNVDIAIDPDLTAIPLSAIKNELDSNTIYVIQNDGVAKKIPVRIQRIIGEYAYIAEDLSSTYTHVVTDHRNIEEGEEVDL